MANMIVSVPKSESAVGVNRKDETIAETEAVQIFVTNCTFLLNGLDPVSTVTHSIFLSEPVYINWAGVL
jgi:hypothetical protein